MITWKMKSNMSDSVFLNRLIVFILLMSGGSTFLTSRRGKDTVTQRDNH